MGLAPGAARAEPKGEAAPDPGERHIERSRLLRFVRDRESETRSDELDAAFIGEFRLEHIGTDGRKIDARSRHVVSELVSRIGIDRVDAHLNDAGIRERRRGRDAGGERKAHGAADEADRTRRGFGGRLRIRKDDEQDHAVRLTPGAAHSLWPQISASTTGYSPAGSSVPCGIVPSKVTQQTRER